MIYLVWMKNNVFLTMNVTSLTRNEIPWITPNFGVNDILVVSSCVFLEHLWLRWAPWRQSLKRPLLFSRKRFQGEINKKVEVSPVRSLIPSEKSKCCGFPSRTNGLIFVNEGDIVRTVSWTKRVKIRMWDVFLIICIGSFLFPNGYNYAMG